MNGTIKKSGRAYLFLSKLLFTILIISVYCIGRSIPLYGIDTSIYDNALDAGMLLEQSVGGDLYKCSVMALGISPYMISSILVQMIVACKPNEAKARISEKKMNRLTVIFMLMLSITQSILRLDELSFVTEPYPFMRLVAFLEMITGACIIMWLCGRNKKYGIGGQTVFIFVNIIDGIMINLRSVDKSEAAMPVLVSVIAAFMMIFMENSEKRIPVQKISIHSYYTTSALPLQGKRVNYWHPEFVFSSGRRKAPVRPFRFPVTTQNRSPFRLRTDWISVGSGLRISAGILPHSCGR